MDLPRSPVFGAAPPPAASVPLKAGHLALEFDPDTGWIRYVRLGDHEAVRALGVAPSPIMAPGAAPFLVGPARIQSTADSFEVRFTLSGTGGEQEGAAQVAITGGSDSRITLAVEMKAGHSPVPGPLQMFVRHPLTECLGRPAQVESADGTVRNAAFTQSIAPGAIFGEWRALTTEPAPGARVETRAESGLFSTADSRNLGGAFFESILQPDGSVSAGSPPAPAVFRIAVGIVGPVRRILPIVQGRPAQLSVVTTTAIPKAPIGLALPREGIRLDDEVIDRLRALRLSHLRCDVDPGDPRMEAQFKEASAISRALDLPVHLALMLGSDPGPEIRSVAAAMAEAPLKIGLWIVLEKDQAVARGATIACVRPSLDTLAPGVFVAAGTAGPYGRINCSRPDAALGLFPACALHSFPAAGDPRTAVESLGAMGAGADSAREFSPRPLVISPLTRLASGSPSDGREGTLFEAAWLLGCLRQLLSAGNVHSLTLGPDLLLPRTARDEAGPRVWPAYHALADLTDGLRFHTTQSTLPLQLDGVALIDAGQRRRILVANLLPTPQEIKIKTGTCRALVRHLDERTVAQAGHDPAAFRSSASARMESTGGKMELLLPPYGLARLDLEE